MIDWKKVIRPYKLLPVILGLSLVVVPLHGYAAAPIFQNAAEYYEGSHSYDTESGDLNEDGHTDLVVIDLIDNWISILLNNGDGTFQAQSNVSVGTKPRDVVIADLNQDNHVDLAITNSESNSVSIMNGHGDGTFNANGTYPVGNYPVGIVAADLNQDGRMDLAVAHNSSHNVYVMLNTGLGTFIVPTTPVPVGYNPKHLAASDFNRDGRMDLAVANDNSSTISILLGLGDGATYSESQIPSGLSPVGIHTADFNSDGFQDLVYAANRDHTANVMLGNGDGTFKTAVVYPFGNLPLDLEVADFNGDGVLDLVGGIQGPDLPILLGNADGTFQPALIFVNYGFFFETGDYNGDGKSDIVMTHPDHVYVLNSAAEGTFDFETSAYQAQEDAGSVSVAVYRTNGSYGQAKVRIQSVDGTAVAGTDYTAINSMVVFNEGETSKLISIPVSNNAVYQGDRTFSVQLSSPANGAVLGTLTTASVTIYEDEPMPDTSAPVIDASKFGANDEYTGTQDQMWGGVGAVSEGNATVRAYPWADANIDGIVDPGELAASISLGSSTADGSVLAASVGDLPPGVYSFIVTAADNAGNESALTAAAAVTVTLSKGDVPDTSAPVIDASKFGANDEYTGTQDQLRGGVGAVSEGNATVRAYPWADANIDGIVDPGELSAPISLGSSMADGSVLAASVGDLPPRVYSFIVTAADNAGNESALTAAAAVAVTLSKGDVPDTTAPVWPADSRLVFTGVTSSGVTLNWPTATDNMGINAYQVYQDGVLINTASVVSTTYSVTSLAADTAYSFTIRAVDAAGNRSLELAGTIKTAAPVNTSSGSSGPSAPNRSSDTTLSELNLSIGDGKFLKLTPEFQPGVTDYTAVTTEAQVELSFESMHPATKIEINGQSVKESYTADLKVGDNLLQLAIRAEDGTTAAYRLTITRESTGESEIEPDAQGKAPFSDMEGHWAEAEIREAFALGIVKGDSSGAFKPNASVNRAEWIVMIERLLKGSAGREDADSAPVFTDEDDIPSWAADSVSAAITQGILTGFADGTFRPGQSVTRAELAAMLARAMKWNIETDASTTFADDAGIPAWAKPYVQAAVENGILQGQGGNRFSPNDPVTRAEAAAILVRLSKLMD